MFSIRVSMYEYYPCENMLVFSENTNEILSKEEVSQHCHRASVEMLLKVNPLMPETKAFLRYAKKLSNKRNPIGQSHEKLGDPLKRRIAELEASFSSEKVKKLTERREYQRALCVAQKAFNQNRLFFTEDQKARFFYHLSFCFLGLKQFGAAAVSSAAGMNAKGLGLQLREDLVDVYKYSMKKFEGSL